MTAGSGSGEGRLEKTELQENKRKRVAKQVGGAMGTYYNPSPQWQNRNTTQSYAPTSFAQPQMAAAPQYYYPTSVVQQNLGYAPQYYMPSPYVAQQPMNAYQYYPQTQYGAQQNTAPSQYDLSSIISSLYGAYMKNPQLFSGLFQQQPASQTSAAQPAAQPATQPAAQPNTAGLGAASLQPTPAAQQPATTNVTSPTTPTTINAPPAPSAQTPQTQAKAPADASANNARYTPEMIAAMQQNANKQMPSREQVLEQQRKMIAQGPMTPEKQQQILRMQAADAGQRAYLASKDDYSKANAMGKLQNVTAQQQQTKLDQISMWAQTFKPDVNKYITGYSGIKVGSAPITPANIFGLTPEERNQMIEEGKKMTKNELGLRAAMANSQKNAMNDMMRAMSQGMSEAEAGKVAQARVAKEYALFAPQYGIDPNKSSKKS